LPERRRPAPGGRLGSCQLCLLHGRRLQWRRRNRTNGAFILGPALTIADLCDGSSRTVAASEQLLGIAGPDSQPSPTPVPSPWRRAIARIAAAPLTDPSCAAAASGWLLNKGAGW
jgi:hypothetical protein